MSELAHHCAKPQPCNQTLPERSKSRDELRNRAPHGADGIQEQLVAIRIEDGGSKAAATVIRNRANIARAKDQSQASDVRDVSQMRVSVGYVGDHV